MTRCLCALAGLATAVLSGCQTVPDLNDNTVPTLRLRLHHQQPGLATPFVEFNTTSAQPFIYLKSCLYVNDPFSVAVTAQDPGGVKFIAISTLTLFNTIEPRLLDGDLVAIPSPAEATQQAWGETFANPGVASNGSTVRLGYSTAKAFDTATLTATYKFKNDNPAGLSILAYNWGQGNNNAQINNVFIQRADPSDPAKQAGMACKYPHPVDGTTGP